VEAARSIATSNFAGPSFCIATVVVVT